MKKMILWMISLLIGGHALTAAGSFAYTFFRSWSREKVDIFICHSYRMSLSHYYLLKMPADDILSIIAFGCLTFLAYIIKKILHANSDRYAENILYLSRVLVIILAVFTGYHVIDALMFWWDFKTAFWPNWVLLFCSIMSAALLMRPGKPGKVISME